MRTRILILSFCNFLFSCSLLSQQPKEVLLVGTMHQVPRIARKAYKPMLKKAIAYQPQAIYVEKQMKEDTVSMKNYYPKLYYKADSLSRVLHFEENELQKLRAKELIELKSEEAKFLSDYYYTQKDHANYEYYRYLSKFGTGRAGKQSNRTENMDLSIPLAIEMDIRELRSMDDQTYYHEYQKYWIACDSISEIDGEEKFLKKDLLKTTFLDVMGFFFGMGKSTNSEKVTTLYHRLNSFEFRKTSCESCDKGNYYWDYRNAKMAENIATQMKKNEEQRSIVIVGAGHIYGLIEAFERDHPTIKIKLYRDFKMSR